MEAISIRKNLLGILIPKISVFGKKLACYEWEPQSLLLLKQNLQHTKNFRLGKNNNNKQQLMWTHKTELLNLERTNTVL